MAGSGPGVRCETCDTRGRIKAAAEPARYRCSMIALLMVKQVMVSLWIVAGAGVGSVQAQNTAPPPPQQQQEDWRGRVDYWQPQWMQRELWGPGRMPKGMQVRMLRHWTYVNHGVPATYARARPTIAATGRELLSGAQLYNTHCASCHGPKGLGNGQSGLSLTPSPALLAYMIKRPIAADEYLLWAIADGGAAFQTAMPAFKDTLPRADIWRIIAYMRNGFTPDRPKR